MLLLNILTGVWWFSSLESRVINNESKLSAIITHESRIAVLEANDNNARSDRLRMEVKIDRILERIAK